MGSLFRTLAGLAALGIAIAACGHYAPPVRPEPPRERAGAPPSAHDAGDAADGEEDDRGER